MVVRKIVPVESTYTHHGLPKEAAVAGPPSPVKLFNPLPAVTVTRPEVDTSLTRYPVYSLKYILPSVNTKTLQGPLMVADVARIPSPLNVAEPVPQRVEMMPLASMARILLAL